MNTLNFFQEGQMFLIPIAVLIITQFLKIIIGLIRGDKIGWKSIFSYGSMPSAHAALFISLTTIMALIQGFNSSAFAISLVMALIFIRDAVGLRGILSKDGKMINSIYTIFSHDKKYNNKIKDQHAPERVGHTPLQVFIGSIIGFLLTFLFYWLINF